MILRMNEPSLGEKTSMKELDRLCHRSESRSTSQNVCNVMMYV